MFQKKFEREKIEIEVFIFQNFFFSAWSEIEVKASSGISRKRKKKKTEKIFATCWKVVGYSKRIQHDSKQLMSYYLANFYIFAKYCLVCPKLRC